MPSLLAACDGPLSGLPKSFTGTLPAASGLGVDWQPDLLADGSFQLRRSYLDRPASDAIGRWVAGADGRSLLLAGDDAPIGLDIASPERLELLDRQARRIEATGDDGLDRAAVPLLEPELEMQGMYRYMADAALFEECRTGRRLPVAFTADNLALERAYLALQQSGALAPGEPVLAELRGRIAMLPPMEGEGLAPQLVPLRFIALHPDRSCPESPTPPGLVGPR